VFPENAQTIAALVALVSIALLGVEVLIVPAVWKKLDYCFFGLPKEKKRNVVRVVLLIVSLPTVVMGIYTIAGIYDLENANVILLSALFIIIVIMMFAALIVWVISRLKGKKKSKIAEKGDELSLLFVTSFVLLIIGILANLMALTGVTAAMLDIPMGPYSAENYNWGRWLMKDAVLFFVAGIFMVGIAYLYENRKRV
jgi:MFS family permease